MKIAICAGHHTSAKGAGNSKYNLNEHDEAWQVVGHLLDILCDKGHRCSMFSGKLSRKIANVNHGNFDLALDIHFNAGGGRGCEVVHVPNSSKRAAQAALMSKAISKAMGTRDRGAKEGWWWGKLKNGKPYKPDAFVAQTNCAAFIPEPLFIDNDSEVAAWFVAGRHAEVAKAIALGIESMKLED